MSGARKNYRFDYYVESIGTRDGKQLNLLLKDYSKEFARRKWRKFDTVSEKYQDQSFSNNSQYLLPGDISLVFEDYRWQIFEKDKLLFSFPQFATVAAPELMAGRYVGMKYFNDGKHYYLLFDRVGRRFFKLYESADEFSYLEQLEGQFVFKNKDKSLSLVKLENNLASRRQVSGSFAADLVNFKSDGRESVILFHSDPGGIYRASNQQLLKRLAGKEGSAERLSEFRVEDKKSASNLESDNYPNLSHFAPKAWFWGYSYSTSMGSEYYFSTTLSDPRAHHTLGVDLNYFSSKVSELAPTVSYVHNFMGHNLFYLGGSYSKDYSYNNSAAKVNLFETSSAFIYFELGLGRWTYSPMFSFINDDIDDFISVRNTRQYDLVQNLSYQSLFGDDFFNAFLWDLHLTQNKTRNYRSFYGVETKARVTFAADRRLKFNLQGSWGRLYKDGVRSGVLFGGEGLESYHHFYGIPEDDIWGNKIRTARAQFSYLAGELYNSWGPFSLQTIHFLGGVDYLKADYIELDETLYSNREWQSVHGGLRFNMKWFYFVPVEADMVYSRIINVHDEVGAGVSVMLGASY